MLPDWLKSENTIYEKLKDSKFLCNDVYTGIDDIRNQYNRHIGTHNENFVGGVYYAAPYSWCADIPQEVNINDNDLKHITVAILNWERQIYIPFIMEIYNNQDYPKNLIEILIIDDCSTNKTEVLNIIKEQVRLYPNLKIRFVQNYVNKCNGPPKRTNMGVRLATHDIVIINETDNLPLGKNYLRGVCYAHNRFKNVSSTGIPISFPGNVLTDIFKDDSSGYHIMNRFGTGVFSFNKELFSKIRGFDEKHIGWGGHEGNIYSRYVKAGGRCFLNLNMYSGNLPNFPVPPGEAPAGPGTDDWQQCDIINDENWGISERMEEINLYE